MVCFDVLLTVIFNPMMIIAISHGTHCVLTCMLEEW